jgi:hypothetical protein
LLICRHHNRARRLARIGGQCRGHRAEAHELALGSVPPPPIPLWWQRDSGK